LATPHQKEMSIEAAFYAQYIKNAMGFYQNLP